jgi:signal transduction histidine kinase
MSQTESALLSSEGEFAGERTAMDNDAIKLRLLATQMLLTNEQERRRLAQAVHDDVSQPMAMAMMLLDVMQRSPSADPNENLKRIRQLLAEAIEQTRTVQLQLSPAMLHELGLAPAVETLAADMRRHGLHVTMSGELADVAIPSDLRVILHQTIRELLTNAARHAQATKAWVTLQLDGGGIRVEVCDDGVGFDPDAALAANSCLGLFNIQTLMEQIGGRLTITTRPGAGATIQCWAPLEPIHPIDSAPTHRRHL